MGHREALALGKVDGQKKRSVEQDRAHLLKHLCTMATRCIVCQVFGSIPCGSTLYQCPTAILGYKSQYEYQGKLLRDIYDSQFKPPLKHFLAASKVCWMCYFPYSYKKHARDDETCTSQKDILLPIAWALFCLPIVLPPDEGHALQDQILTKAGITTSIFDTVSDYAKWLAKPHDVVQSTSNLVELCLAFAELIIAKEWM